MPYCTQWVDPEVFMEHEGVTIYHTYKDCEFTKGELTYWFTTNELDAEEDFHFDVRELRLYASDPESAIDDGSHPPPLKDVPAYQELMSGERPNEKEVIAEILRTAIEQGLLKQDEAYPA